MGERRESEGGRNHNRATGRAEGSPSARKTAGDIRKKKISGYTSKEPMLA